MKRETRFQLKAILYFMIIALLVLIFYLFYSKEDSITPSQCTDEIMLIQDKHSSLFDYHAGLGQDLDKLGEETLTKEIETLPRIYDEYSTDQSNVLFRDRAINRLITPHPNSTAYLIQDNQPSKSNYCTSHISEPNSLLLFLSGIIALFIFNHNRKLMCQQKQ